MCAHPINLCNSLGLGLSDPVPLHWMRQGPWLDSAINFPFCELHCLGGLLSSRLGIWTSGITILAHIQPLAVCWFFYLLVWCPSSQVALVIKNPPANAGEAGDMGSIPGSGRFPGGRHGNPLQYSCLENPVQRGAWRATVRKVVRVRHSWRDLARRQWAQHFCHPRSATGEPVFQVCLSLDFTLLVSPVTSAVWCVQESNNFVCYPTYSYC